MDLFELLFALVIILIGAQLFTNGVEWVGEGFGLSEGAVGSVLAAIGTALPETSLPIVAIIGGGHANSEEIGIGAILGAPFMLSTLAIGVLGGAALGFARSGRREPDVRPERRAMIQDLSFFLVMYAVAMAAGIWHVAAVRYVVAAALISAYVVYVWLHFRGTDEEVEREVAGEVHPLYLAAWLGRIWGRAAAAATAPRVSASIAQSVVALALIVAGARVFVAGISHISTKLGISGLIFSLLVAPVATELPEQFNGVLWLRRRKDTLAIGNVTGAMVFQSSIPVTIGLLFTPWELSEAGLVSGAIALVAGGILLISIWIGGRLHSGLMIAQTVLYAAYVTFALLRY